MLHRHLQDREQTHLEQFKTGYLLHKDCQAIQIEVAKAVGAWEVYSYLLTMNEEDLSHE